MYALHPAFQGEISEHEAQKYGGKFVGLVNALKRGATIPPTLALTGIYDTFTQIMEQVNNLGLRDTRFFAIRSSARVEDSSAASFAGMFLTQTNCERGRLLGAISEVRLASQNAKLYGQKLDIAVPATLPCLIQPMIFGPYAGTFLSRDLYGYDLNASRMEVVCGPGELLVSGKVAPAFTLNRDFSHDTPMILQTAYADLTPWFGETPSDVEFVIDAAGQLIVTQFRPISDAALEAAESARIYAVGQGTISGYVRRITEETVDDARFEDGFILVAHHTTPALIGPMLNAAAIITEVGGQTSHAAIVAREMNKPCIVGMASAVTLNDGDFITLDLNTKSVYRGGASNGNV